MPINSRQKGAAAEREIAKILREHGYADARRGQQFHGGADSPDVLGIEGVHIEVKRVEKLNLTDAYAQSKRDADPSEIPIVVHRKSREPWMVTMSFEDFLTIWGAIPGLGEEWLRSR